MQIPKVQKKDSQDVIIFGTIGICARKSCSMLLNFDEIDP